MATEATGTVLEHRQPWKRLSYRFRAEGNKEHPVRRTRHKMIACTKPSD